MQQPAKQPRLFLVLHVLGLVAGIVVVVYAVLLWSDYGFTPGPFRRDAPDPSAPARWFFLVGLAVVGYCVFTLWTFIGRTKRKAKDDGTSSI
jgi:hypothetical protein